MAKKYLNYVGLETLAEIIKARFAPIELAIGRDSNDNLVAVTTRIKDEGADADYKEKYITLYTFEANDRTFIITTRDLRTGKTTDDIYDTTGELKLSAIYSPLEYTLRDVLKLVDPEETGMKVMYSVRDQLDEIIEDEGYSISKVEYVNENTYNIEVSNGKDNFITHWTVVKNPEGHTVWTSEDTDQTITMVGFDPEATVGKFYRVDGTVKGEIFNDYEHNVASGDFSAAHGVGTVAEGFATFAVGTYNDPNTTDVFVVGVGAGDRNRRNALLVKDTGDIYIAEDLYFTSMYGDNLTLRTLVEEVYKPTEIPISSAARNIITMKNDGLYATVDISKAVGNLITRKSDGIYASYALDFEDTNIDWDYYDEDPTIIYVWGILKNTHNWAGASFFSWDKFYTPIN